MTPNHENQIDDGTDFEAPIYIGSAEVREAEDMALAFDWEDYSDEPTAEFDALATAVIGGRDNSLTFRLDIGTPDDLERLGRRLIREADFAREFAARSDGGDGQ